MFVRYLFLLIFISANGALSAPPPSSYSLQCDDVSVRHVWGRWLIDLGGYNLKGSDFAPIISASEEVVAARADFDDESLEANFTAVGCYPPAGSGVQAPLLGCSFEASFGFSTPISVRFKVSDRKTSSVRFIQQTRELANITVSLVSPPSGKRYYKVELRTLYGKGFESWQDISNCKFTEPK